MPNTLIIGYGNPLRCDDGVGVRAAERLAARDEEVDASPSPPEGIAVIACHQLTIELAPLVAAVERLILMDACAEGEPGTLHERNLAPAALDIGSLSHHLDPRGLLAAAQILYGRAPAAVLLTVSGGSFDYGEALSPAVAAALPQLLARIRQLARA